MRMRTRTRNPGPDLPTYGAASPKSQREARLSARLLPSRAINEKITASKKKLGIIRLGPGLRHKPLVVQLFGLIIFLLLIKDMRQITHTITRVGIIVAKYLADHRQSLVRNGFSLREFALPGQQIGQ